MGGTTVYVRDVANVRDGFAPQTSIVHANGRRAVLLSDPQVRRRQHARRRRNAVKRTLPPILATLPKELKVTLLFDQSVFVRAAVDGVVKEAAIAAVLTGLMILLFLGSWRSTLIVVISIPLSILVSIIVLSALGQTLNVMTLGGMSLAVGILVDDATVEIENIHRNLPRAKTLSAGHPRRRAADRRAGLRLHAVHLHRLRARALHRRRREVALRPARRWPSSSRC